MAKTKHTPGPWKIGAWCSPGRALFSENARLFAGTRYLGFVQGYPNPNEAEQVSMPEADANARLIAAAPELLEGLIVADRLLTQCLTVLCDKAIADRLPFGLLDEVKQFVIGNVGTRAIQKAEAA